MLIPISQREALSFLIGKQWADGEYNGNNAWLYNSTNGALNNNNKYNSYQVRVVLESDSYDNSALGNYELPLEVWYDVNRQCRRRKGMKPSCLIFQYHLVVQLVEIVHQVGNCEYTMRVGICFMITIPRLREVLAADYGDRMVQTWYFNELNWWLEHYHLHPDSYSCRVGKGGLRAVQQFQEYVFEESEGYTVDCYVASLDLQSFFMSIDTEIAVRLMERFIMEVYRGPHRDLLLYLTRVIYQSLPQSHCVVKSHRRMWVGFPERKSLLGKSDGIGIPIGNITSQMIANFLTTFYLNYLTSLGYKFIHYTDDTAFVFRDKERFLEDVGRFEWFLWNELHLTLHPDKRYIQHYSKGICLLGYKLKRDRILPSDRIVHNVWWKVECSIRKAEGNMYYMLREKEHFVQVINSYMGLMKHTNSFRLRREILNRIAASPWGEILDIDLKDYLKVLPKEKYTTRAYFTRRNKKRKKERMELRSAYI